MAGFTPKENSGTANVRGLASKSKAESIVEEKRDLSILRPPAGSKKYKDTI